MTTYRYKSEYKPTLTEHRVTIPLFPLLVINEVDIFKPLKCN